MPTLKELDAQDAVNKLCEHLLGDDYYIVDPLCNSQCNAIIVDEIISRYKGATESPANKWRRRHKRCRFCKYCDYEATRPWCKVKRKFVNVDYSRVFCKVFQLKPYKED